MELPLNESMDAVKDLQIKDIAMVKFYSMSFKPKIIGGNPLTDSKASDGGDLMIYTKRDYNAEEKTKGLPKTKVIGYTLEKRDDLSLIPAGNDGSLYWKSDWTVESGQSIFVHLPAGDLKEDVEIIIEGINAFSAPYRFTQKLVFR